ncbi:MAG: hypothetical protein HQL50_13300, partial [Magnetococcales bacterium]|nr:hypothetical protein [Magnetococcales bacterium]
MNCAILFTIFNRPETTRTVFDAIRKARPSRLYVAADGPRSERPEDVALCQHARQLATEVDWPCTLHTHFQDRNMGCKYAMISALDWFFSLEEAGIILEDDCLPHQDFFTYCLWALETYQQDRSVWHINGNNFNAPSELFGDNTTAFTSLAQAWGWATWRDRWFKCEHNAFYLMSFSRTAYPQWRLSLEAKWNKLKHIRELQTGLSIWDYGWQVTILNHQGRCLSSRANLISNLGDGPSATHTPVDDRTHLPTRSMDGPLEARHTLFNTSLNRWYETKMGMASIRKAARYFLESTKTRYILAFEALLARVLFFGVRHSVVASTGRSGSTL